MRLYYSIFNLYKVGTTGNTPISKLQFNSLTSHPKTAIPPFFKHSTGNPSSPGAFPDFISFTYSPISSNYFALSFKSPNTGIRQD